MSFSNTVTLANTFADFVEQFNELAVYVNNNIISADANGVANVTANEVNFSGNVYVVGTLSAGLISLTGNTEANNLHVAGILTVDGNSQFNSAAVFSNTVNVSGTLTANTIDALSITVGNVSANQTTLTVGNVVANTTTLIVSVLAAALLIAAGVYFLRPPQPVSAKDQGQATTSTPQTAQSDLANAK